MQPLYRSHIYAQANIKQMSFFKKIINQEFLAYLVIGGLTALIYFCFFVLNIEFFKLSYRIGMSIAYVFAVGFHFFANRKFTFTVDGQLSHQWLRYLAFLLINYLITIAVVSVCVEQFLLSPYAGVWISLVFTTSTGYFLARHWVFNIAGEE